MRIYSDVLASGDHLVILEMTFFARFEKMIFLVPREILNLVEALVM